MSRDFSSVGISVSSIFWNRRCEHTWDLFAAQEAA